MVYVDLSLDEIKLIRNTMHTHILWVNRSGPTIYESLLRKLDSINDISKLIELEAVKDGMCIAAGHTPWTDAWYRFTKHCCCSYCGGGWFNHVFTRRRPRCYDTVIQGYKIGECGYIKRIKSQKALDQEPPRI